MSGIKAHPSAPTGESLSSSSIVRALSSWRSRSVVSIDARPLRCCSVVPPWFSRSISHVQRISTPSLILGRSLFAVAHNDPASLVERIIYRNGSKHIENAGPEAGRNSDELMKQRRNGGCKNSGADGAWVEAKGPKNGRRVMEVRRRAEGAEQRVQSRGCRTEAEQSRA